MAAGTFLRIRALTAAGFWRADHKWAGADSYARVDDEKVLAELEGERSLAVTRVGEGELTAEQKTEADAWGDARKPAETQLPAGTASEHPSVEDTFTNPAKPPPVVSTDNPTPQPPTPAKPAKKSAAVGTDGPDPAGSSEAPLVEAGPRAEDVPGASDHVVVSSGGTSASVSPGAEESSNFFGKRKR